MNNIDKGVLQIVRITPCKGIATQSETQEGSVVVRWLKNDTRSRKEVFTGSFAIVGSESFILLSENHSRENLDNIVIGVRNRPPTNGLSVNLDTGTACNSIRKYSRFAQSVIRALHLFGWYTKEQLAATLNYMKGEVDRELVEEQKRNTRDDILEALRNTVVSPEEVRDILMSHTGCKVTIGKRL